MEVAGALGAAAPILESIFQTPLGVRVGPGLGVVVKRTPFQTKFQPAWFRASVVLNYSCYVVLGLNRLGGRKFVCILGLSW